MILRKYFPLALSLFLFVLGCSGGSNTPISPPGSASSIPGTLDNIPLINLSETGGVTQAIGLLGAYELTINPENMTAELVSKRTSAIGDSYIVNGAAFFTILPCANCLNLIGIDFDIDGKGWLMFEITHPFAPGSSGDPPSASNRNDLDVFDLAMVIHPVGGATQTFSQSGVSLFNTTCVGADGYTTELLYFIADTAALPYFLCVDDSADQIPPVSTWNKFPMGGSTTFDVGFDLSGPVLFDIYLTMGYGHSAAKADRLTPKYYNPEFNRKAAWKVDVAAPTGTTIGTTWDTLDIFPQDVVVSVYDWQIGAPVATAADFGDALETEIFAASDPSQVTVEVLGMSASLPTASTPDDPLATGRPDDPWVYTIAVPHDASPSLAPGTYPGLVTVTDSRIPVGTPPAATNDYLIDSPDGIVLNYYNIDSFVTYQTFWANVVLGLPTPVTNVTIATNRSAVTYGYPFYSAGPWTLTWAAANTAVEYAIYYDNDPSDGLMNNPVYVDATTYLTYAVPGSHLPSNHEVPGNTYVVRSRSNAGDAGSEAADSQQAHIMVNGWETLNIYQTPGWGNDGEGWKASTEIHYTSIYMYYPHTRSNYAVHGISDIRTASGYVGDNISCGNYQGITRETPIVADAPVRFLEISGHLIGSSNKSGYYGGFIIGTCSTQIDYPWSDATDFEWAQAASGGHPSGIPYWGYNRDNSQTNYYVSNTFDDVPASGDICWDAANNSTNAGYLIGGDCNDGGNPDDPYIGIMSCRSGYYTWRPEWQTDEYAIMIY